MSTNRVNHEDKDEKLYTSATRSFGESTHIGMTMALLEPMKTSPASFSSANMSAKSISDSLMDSILAEVDNHRNGKTPRIDIRLSLNGGAIVAVSIHRG